MLFDASTLAAGWLSVSVASRPDKTNPVINQTIRIEEYDTGVRLIATDRYMLVTTFVPSLTAQASGDAFIDPAANGELPNIVATAYDPHNRAKGLLAHLWKLAEQADPNEGDDEVLVRLKISPPRELTSGAPVLEGMQVRDVTIEHPDHERVTLTVNEGEWPDYRRLISAHHNEATKVIALHHDRLGALAALGKIHGGRPILWRFGGANRGAAIEVAESEPPVTGLVMPVAWVWEVNADGTPPIPPADQPSPPSEGQDRAA